MLVVHGPLQLVAHGPLHSAEASASFLDVEHDSAVRRHFLFFLDAMLDAQLVMEEDMVEPDTFYVDESWRPLHAHALAEPAAACLADLAACPPDSADCPPASAACPPGLAACPEALAACPQCPADRPVVNALTLVSMFGNREQAKVSGMGIVGNKSYDGKTIWVALAVSHLVNEHVTAKAVDGHVTLLYGQRGAVDYFDRVLENMRQHMRSKAWKSEEVFSAQAQWEYATEGYGWVDIIVHSPLHRALHVLVHAGLSGIPCQRAFMMKQA